MELIVASTHLVLVSLTFQNQKVVPGFFYFLGVVPDGTQPEKVFPNHSPKFWIDERVLKIGVITMTNLALDYLSAK